MDCWEYVGSYLGADADRELSAEERRAADAHLEGCAKCQARLEEERALKAALKRHLRKVVAPREVKTAIRAALDRADAASAPAGRLLEIRAEFRRPQMWAPLLALAASIVFVVTMRDRIAWEAPVPAFDQAIQKFTGFEKHFEPNVPSDSFSAVAEHYHSARMPSYIWNFAPFGYQLIGGRIDPLPNGRPATYTFYRGPNGAVMCTRFRVSDLVIPQGGRELRTDQYLYQYKGFSLVLSLESERQWVCVLMSRLPAQAFAEEIEFLEG